MTTTPNIADFSKSDLIGLVQRQQDIISDQQEKLHWYADILSNKALPVNMRLALIATKKLVDTRKPGEDGFTRAHLPALADSVGVSASTISRAVQKLADCTEAIDRRVEPDKTDPYKSIVYLRPTALLDRPQEIAPVKDIKRHGGDHRITCPSCGGENIVEQKKHICSDCGTVVKEFDLRLINPLDDTPLHDAMGEDPQEETFTAAADILTSEETNDDPARCILQPLTAYTVLSDCNAQRPALPELQALQQWVCWRLEKRGGKLTKVPYDAATGKKASSTDPATWRLYEQAQAVYEESQAWKGKGKIPYDGVGFVFNGDYVGIDLDHCIPSEPGGEPSERAMDIIARFCSYTELSPSRTGIHIIVRGTLPAGVKRDGIEMYGRGRFFTITGQHLAGTPEIIKDSQTELDTLYTELNPPKERPVINMNRGSYAPRLLSDTQILEKARNGKNGSRFVALWGGDTSGYGSPSNADMALCNELAYWTDNDVSAIDRLFRQSGLYREKWDSPARSGETYGEGTIQRALAPASRWLAS